MTLWKLNMTNDGLCIQEKWHIRVKDVDVSIVTYNSIYVNTHEGGTNGNQKDGRGIHASIYKYQLIRYHQVG
jgi:hypothetical protein